MLVRYHRSSHFLNAILFVFFSHVGIFCATAQTNTDYQADVESIESSMDALLETISGPSGRSIDWNRFRNLFRGDVPFYIRSNRNGEWSITELSVEKYINNIGPNLEKRDFFETASNLHLSRYGDMASVFMVYESKAAPTDAKPFDRGINSLELMFDGNRWWIVSLMWQAESTGVAIPDRWLSTNKHAADPLPVAKAVADPERDAVQKVIMAMFDGMRAGDSSAIRPLFLPQATMQTVLETDKGPQVRAGSVAGFLNAIGTPREAMLDERIWSYDIRIDGRLANVWTEYGLYLGENFAHCGVNNFQLFKSTDGWQILSITDTRRKDDTCWKEKPDLAAELDQLIDNWHHAAAAADEEVFFGSMTPDGIYLGTDASERWERDVFREWAKSAFERETAWDFKSHDRQYYFSANGQTGWWEEALDTWMGPCRGSGVAVKTPEGWRIKHYNLSFTIPNDKVDAVKTLLNP